MHVSSAILACLFLALGTSVQAANPVMTFECQTNGLGDVCDNMCYGATCKKWGSSFTWDKPGKPEGSRRSGLAGCGSGNRCSKPPYGNNNYQCDEYPFKSVKESAAGGQVNRCVETKYNNAQSQVIKNFYNSYAQFKGKGCDKKHPCQFNIAFNQAQNIKWCKPSPDCTNDGNEFTKAGVAKRSEQPQQSNGAYYKLANGDVIFAPDELDIGASAYRTVLKNATLFDEYNKNHVPDLERGYEQFEYMMHNLDMEEHTVVGKVESTEY